MITPSGGGESVHVEVAPWSLGLLHVYDLVEHITVVVVVNTL